MAETHPERPSTPDTYLEKVLTPTRVKELLDSLPEAVREEVRRSLDFAAQLNFGIVTITDFRDASYRFSPEFEARRNAPIRNPL